MKIAEITAFHVKIPLKKVIRHASHSRTSTDSLVVKCTLENGTTGFGEGLPREYVTGETIDSSFEALRQSSLNSQFFPCSTFHQALDLAEKIVLPANDDRECSANAARCAVELALLDAYGKKFGEPLSSTTRILAGDLFHPVPYVRYSGILTSSQGMKLRAASLLFRLYGFKQVKIKVGIQGQNDFSRLRTARRWLGYKMDIRVDANEAWTLEETQKNLPSLESLRISAIEQPVPHEQIARLAELRKQSKIPFVLDESLCSMVDAKRCLDGGYGDIFNLRLSKCGGFIPSLRLAQFARRHGLHYQLGCQVGETAILTAAGRHFAASVREIRYWEGSYDRHLVTEALGDKDLTFGRGGWAKTLPGPGLGISVNEEALKRVVVRQEVLRG
ncbi:MAG: dipeptide epimerase [Gemmataceae bacterium]|nr:dipeptide epimerase [Gemmataceae bacterium]